MLLMSMMAAALFDLAEDLVALRLRGMDVVRVQIGFVPLYPNGPAPGIRPMQARRLRRRL
jgi:hypothetical protein